MKPRQFGGRRRSGKKKKEKGIGKGKIARFKEISRKNGLISAMLFAEINGLKKDNSFIGMMKEKRDRILKHQGKKQAREFCKIAGIENEDEYEERKKRPPSSKRREGVPMRPEKTARDKKSGAHARLMKNRSARAEAQRTRARTAERGRAQKSN